MSFSGTVMVQDGVVADGGGEQISGHPSPETDPVLPTIEFVSPIAGFAQDRNYVLVELDDLGLLCSLQSLENPNLRFLVLPPAPFFPAYEPEISDDWAEQLDITSAEEALVLLIVTTGASAAEATANLLAPVVINLRTRQAAQVVLDDASLPLRAPLRAPG